MEEEVNWKERAERYEKQIRALGATPIEKRGLHNWKNLFRKPSFNDYLLLFLIAMAIFMGFAYQTDVATCREFVANFTGYCAQYYKPLLNESNPITNWSNFNFTLK